MQHFFDVLDEPLLGSVVSIGNFDGVHRGHVFLLQELVRRTKDEDGNSAIVTFEPHPLRLLHPSIAPARITTLGEKLRLIARQGVDLALVLRFDQKLAAMDPTAFLERMIIDRFHPRTLVVGHDFSFGRHRKGSTELLERFCSGRGIQLVVVEPVEYAGHRVSSTGIRQALVDGAVRWANELLGYLYSVEGKVVKGEARGRELGFATANLRISELLLREGVYAGMACWPGGKGLAAVHVGPRPTFGVDEIGIEVHILDQNPDLYGTVLRIRFADYLRPIRRFLGPTALQARIAKDVAAVRKLNWPNDHGEGDELDEVIG